MLKEIHNTDSHVSVNENTMEDAIQDMNLITFVWLKNQGTQSVQVTGFFSDTC